jgi:hypothetical protein
MFALVEMKEEGDSDSRRAFVSKNSQSSNHVKQEGSSVSSSFSPLNNISSSPFSPVVEVNRSTCTSMKSEFLTGSDSLYKRRKLSDSTDVSVSDAAALGFSSDM